MKAFFASVRLLPRPFWALAGATFVTRFGVFVWPFLTLYIIRSGNTELQASVAISCYSVGSLTGALLGGWLADRLGRNVTMALSSFGSAACMMMLSQATDWRWIALIAFCTAVASDSGHPSTSALVQDIVPKEQLLVAFSVNRFAVNLGWSMGPLCAGLLAEKSFFWLFVVDAITSAFFGIVALLFLPRGVRTISQQSGWPVAWASIKKNRSILALFIAVMCGAWTLRQCSTTFMHHMSQSGITPADAGKVLAVNGLMIICVEMLLAASTRAWTPVAMLALGYVLMGTAYLPLLGSATLGIFFLSMVIFTTGEMFAFSRQQPYIASLAPADMRGRYSGFINIAWATGGIISSVGGLNLYAIDPALVWWACALLGTVSATALLTLRD